MLQTPDSDGLNDGIEIENWFDPLEDDYDKDGRDGLLEYQEGTSPYAYDKSWDEHLADFRDGFFGGEFIEDTDSIPCMLGKITSGFTPVGNVRDMIIDVIQGDWLDAGLNFAGTFIDATDVVKTGGIIGKFLLKNSDNIGLYAEILTFLNKNFPDAVKHLGKSDEFVMATKEVVKASNGKITKKQYQEMLKSFAEDGIENALFSWYLVLWRQCVFIKALYCSYKVFVIYLIEWVIFGITFV